MWPRKKSRKPLNNKRWKKQNWQPRPNGARYRTAVSGLEEEIAADEAELRGLESEKPPRPPARNTQSSEKNERKDETIMGKRQIRAFGGMTMEQRDAFIRRDDVQEFLIRFREMFRVDQKRSVTGGELLIPTVVLEVLRENIEDYSKMIRHVRLISVSGNARQTVMGTIPEAVWTEMCAALNELNFSLSNAEVDGYKVGGYVAVCNALLEDSDRSEEHV